MFKSVMVFIPLLVLAINPTFGQETTTELGDEEANALLTAKLQELNEVTARGGDIVEVLNGTEQRMQAYYDAEDIGDLYIRTQTLGKNVISVFHDTTNEVEKFAPVAVLVMDENQELELLYYDAVAMDELIHRFAESFPEGVELEPEYREMFQEKIDQLNTDGSMLCPTVQTPVTVDAQATPAPAQATTISVTCVKADVQTIICLLVKETPNGTKVKMITIRKSNNVWSISESGVTPWM